MPPARDPPVRDPVGAYGITALVLINNWSAWANSLARLVRFIATKLTLVAEVHTYPSQLKKVPDTFNFPNAKEIIREWAKLVGAEEV